MWPSLLIFVLQLNENSGKNFKQEIHLTRDQTLARCVRSNYVVVICICVLETSEVRVTICVVVF